jgi:hypothetical protein
MGPLYLLRGMGVTDYRHTRSLGTHKRRATARRPRAAKRRGLHPARAAGCDIYATVLPQCNDLPIPGPRPAKRARRKESRAAAHNLCVYNAGAPATICRIDISRSVVLDSWIVDEYIFNY